MKLTHFYEILHSTILNIKPLLKTVSNAQSKLKNIKTMISCFRINIYQLVIFRLKYDQSTANLTIFPAPAQLAYRRALINNLRGQYRYSLQGQLHHLFMHRN